LLSEARFDVIHTSRATAHLMAAMVVGGRGKLVHLRGSAAPPSARAANRFLYRRLTDAVVASSSRVRRWVLERLNVPEERVLRVFAPVDAERFAPRARDETLASELGVPDTARLVVNVARLAPVKGQDVLIEAMPDVLRAHGEAVLVLVGEAWSGQLEALTHRASQLGVDGSLVFAGRREDVARFVSSASVCVSSSVGSEENSRAVAEYMASGRPIVATSVGVVPELLADNVSGVLVPPGDPEAMAGAVRGVLADDASAAAMGAEARRFALSQLSHDAFARSVSSILGSVGIDL
jgi:glycosyltransferase involved in cell wall biosynthesis